LKRLFIGNTAKKTPDRLTCDVLIVKPRSFSHRIGRVLLKPRVLPGCQVRDGTEASTRSLAQWQSSSS
jgi:hypothetical protein